MAEIISQREFGRRIEVSEASVRKAITAGYIVQGSVPKENGGRAISYEIALHEWNNSPAGLKAAVKNMSTGSPDGPVKQRVTVLSSGPDNQNVTEDLSQAKLPIFDPALAESKKAILEDKRTSSRISMQRQALQLQKEMNKLVDKDRTEGSLFEFGKAIRENIMQVSSRCIDRIRAAADNNEAKNILDEELKTSLRLLASPPDLST